MHDPLMSHIIEGHTVRANPDRCFIEGLGYCEIVCRMLCPALWLQCKLLFPYGFNVSLCFPVSSDIIGNDFMLPSPFSLLFCKQRACRDNKSWKHNSPPNFSCLMLLFVMFGKLLNLNCVIKIS